MTFPSAISLFLALLGITWLLLVWQLRHRESRGPRTGVAAADLLAGGLLFTMTAAFFWRTISGDVFQPADGGDLVSFLFPTYRFAARQISQASLPLWNPHLYGGAPFISDIQAGFLYPPNLLLFLFNPTFDYRWLQTFSQLHLYWAGLGVYVLVRSLRWERETPSRAAALFSALAFQLSDPLLVHLGNLNLIAVLSWLPWVLAAFHYALARHSLRWCALCAFLFATANYAGHAQSSIYLAFAIGLYWLFASPIASESSTDKGTTRLFSRLFSTVHYPLITLILTLLLSAPILLPAIEMSVYTERAELNYQETIEFSLAPTQAIGLLTPGFFGRGPALHWSLWDRVETPYAGLITLMLAMVGLLLASHHGRRQLWPWLGIGLFGFVTALGVYSILHGWLTLIVPGFDQLRAPARALVLWTLGIAVVAAFGLDRLRHLGATQTQKSVEHGFLRGGAFFLACIAVPLAYLALLLTQESETMFLRASVAALAVTVAAFFWLAGWGAIAALRASWIHPNNFAWLMVGLLFAEFAANGGPYLDVSESDPTRGYDHPEIVRFLKEDPSLFRIDTRTEIQAFWQPDAAAVHGLQDVWGVANPLVLEHWKRLWDATGGRQSRLYDSLNVKYVLVPDGVPLPEGKFELALDAPGELSIHRNLNFMPRAWVVHAAEAVAAEEDVFAALRAEQFDPYRTVILMDESRVSTFPPDTNATAAVLHYGSSEMTLRVQTATAGYLVLSEVWYPGWRASVNGTPQPVLRANGALRAVQVPAGESTVVLSFQPWGWRWGLVGLVLGGLIFLVLIAWRPAIYTPK